jgi:hypothetical protein
MPSLASQTPQWAKSSDNRRYALYLAIAKHLGSPRSTVYRLLEPAQAA